MNVVATAPSPGVRIPSRPVAGAIDLGAAPEEDLGEANFYLRCIYDFARRGAGMLAAFGEDGLAGAGSLIMRIGFASICWVAR